MATATIDPKVFDKMKKTVGKLESSVSDHDKSFAKLIKQADDIHEQTVKEMVKKNDAQTKKLAETIKELDGLKKEFHTHRKSILDDLNKNMKRLRDLERGGN